MMADKLTRGRRGDLDLIYIPYFFFSLFIFIFTLLCCEHSSLSIVLFYSLDIDDDSCANIDKIYNLK